MAAEPLTPEQIEELRRAVEAWESAPVSAVIFRTAESEAAMIAKFVGHRHRILALADHYHAMLRRMAKAPAGPAPAGDREIIYFNRPI